MEMIATYAWFHQTSNWRLCNNYQNGLNKQWWSLLTDLSQQGIWLINYIISPAGWWDHVTLTMSSHHLHIWFINYIILPASWWDHMTFDYVISPFASLIWYIHLVMDRHHEKCWLHHIPGFSRVQSEWMKDTKCEQSRPLCGFNWNWHFLAMQDI